MNQQFGSVGGSPIMGLDEEVFGRWFDVDPSTYQVSHYAATVYELRGALTKCSASCNPLTCKDRSHQARVWLLATPLPVELHMNINDVPDNLEFHNV